MVHVNRLELREVYGERFCVGEVTLEWPQTNAVKAIVAIWDHVVASRLLDQVYKLDSGEICEVGIGGLDFLYNSAKKYWHPILDALKTAGYKPTRDECPKRRK